MRSVYDALLSLNSIDNAHAAWADYRASLTAFISAHAKGGSCLIVGAGACNDIDLLQLSAHFDTVTLLDTDSEAMEQAKKQYPSDRIVALRADMLGVNADAYRAFDAGMQADMRAGKSAEALTAAFLQGMERLLLHAQPDPLPEADTLICCGVHSQLLAMFARMAAVYARYAPIDTQRIYKHISRHNAAFQPAFNTRLLAAARRTLVLGLETERMGMPGGLEGAAQALADISARHLSGIQAGLLWPFDAAQNKLYRVRVMAIDRQKSE